MVLIVILHWPIPIIGGGLFSGLVTAFVLQTWRDDHGSFSWWLFFPLILDDIERFALHALSNLPCFVSPMGNHARIKTFGEAYEIFDGRWAWLEDKRVWLSRYRVLSVEHSLLRFPSAIGPSRDNNHEGEGRGQISDIRGLNLVPDALYPVALPPVIPLRFSPHFPPFCLCFLFSNSVSFYLVTHLPIAHFSLSLAFVFHIAFGLYDAWYADMLLLWDGFL